MSIATTTTTTATAPAPASSISTAASTIANTIATGASVSKNTVLVTGATGNAGFTALKCLSDSKTFNVRAGSFNKSAKRDLVRQLPGLESVYEYDADTIDEVMDSSFRGVDYVYIIPSRSRNRVQHVCNYMQLAQKYNVKFIVLFSMLRPLDASRASNYGKAYDQMEAVVEQSGIKYSIIRNSILQQSLFLFQPDIVKGIIPLPIGRGQFAPVNVCDTACLVHQILLNPQVHTGKAYHLTGPEMVDGFRLADIATRALGRPIRFANISAQNCRMLLIDSGLEDWLADEFIEFFTDVANNRFAQTFTADMYRSITGKSGVTLNDFFVAHAQRFGDVARVKPLEDVSEGVSDRYAARVVQPSSVVPAVTSSRVVSGVVQASQVAPIAMRTPMTSDRGYSRLPYTGSYVEPRQQQQPEFDREIVLNELGRTHDLISKWILQQNGLLQLLGDIVRQEDLRLRQFQAFRDEVYQTLMDVGQY